MTTGSDAKLISQKIHADLSGKSSEALHLRNIGKPRLRDRRCDKFDPDVTRCHAICYALYRDFSMFFNGFSES